MSTPSIFNDVIGPVMRGPSSSHSAAAVRIGLLGRQLMGGKLRKVKAYFDLDGSLPTTYLSQGSDMGLCSGLLGFQADDERLLEYRSEMEKANIEIEYFCDHYGDTHPNTYNLTLENEDEHHQLTAISTGGGIFQVTKIDGHPVSYFSDCYALVLWSAQFPSRIIELLNTHGFQTSSADCGDRHLVFATNPAPLKRELLKTLENHKDIQSFRLLTPMLPILTPSSMELPFTNAAEMKRYADTHGITDLADLALHYEGARGDISHDEILEKAAGLIDILENSIHAGLQGTTFRDRILGAQAGNYVAANQEGKLLNLGVLDTIIPNVTALMEVKSSMGVIVAAPTAGSCGGLPGAVIAVGDVHNLDRETKARGLLAAGIIGVFVATKSTFAAEVCGCQAECGVSSGMTAAAIATMLGGNYTTALTAASLAFQNIFGMVCDPVANRVEVPCLGKNILAASNGVSCANLALADYNPVIPFDEVVEAMDQVGRALPHELRCTALGGLSITPTSRIITEKLNNQ